MKYQNNILICVIICISIYFLLSGAIIEGVTVTPEENDKDLSKKSRLYLQGIDDQLTKLGEIRNKKRRTPVNIHIDVGDAQGTKSNVVVENQGKEGYDNFPPTLGNAQENNSNVDLEGVGRPDQEKFGLQQRSKNNGDIRNFSKFQSGDHGECHYLPPPPPPVKEVPPCGSGSLGRCSEIDHRGCRHARHKLAPPPQIQSQSHGGGISYKEGFAAGDWAKGGAGGAAVEEGEEKKNDGADAGGTGAGGASAGGGGSGSYCQSSNSPKWGCTKTVTESASGNKEFAYKNHKNWKESNKKAVENWKKEEAAKEKKYKEKKKTMGKEEGGRKKEARG